MFFRAGSRTATWLTLLLVLLLPTLAVSVSLAQSGEADHATPSNGVTAVEATGEALPQLGEMFMFSPIINGIIAALSVVAVMLFLFFLLTITPRAMAPPDFIDEVTKLVIRGKHDAASDLCRAHRRAFVASVVQRCVDNPHKGHSVIMDMIDAEGRRRADVVWNRISYLADVSNIAPMLGLLGTVLGMITAFFGLEREAGTIDAAILSQGVGQAMATTMFGLVVGIMAMTFYSIIKARATRSLAEAEQAVHSITDHLKRDHVEA
ncbi:MAG: MotA/TolQ/ExbB proton channel family protein [Phycisphaeraceae bacterium]